MGIAAPPRGAAGVGLESVANNLTSESLVSVGWDGRPGPKLASEWEWLPGRLGVRLRLHASARFHDGSRITASVVRDVLKQSFLSPALKASSVTFASAVSVEAEDDRTLVVHFKQPEAFFLADLAIAAIDHPVKAGVGAGPYRRVEQPSDAGHVGSIIRLAAFADYYRGRPALDFIELSHFDEQRSAWAALMRGNIDAVHEVNPAALDFVEAQSTLKTFPFTRPYFIQLMFNLRHPVLKHAAVRQALSNAVDRQRLIDVALNGRGVVAEGPIWPMHWAYSTAPKSYRHNPEAAVLRLTAAGFGASRTPEPGRMPSRFRFRCLTVANEARYEKIATVLQKQLEEIGVDMEVEAVPYEKLGQKVRTGDFDALLIERSSGRSLAWTYMTFHSSMTPGGYSAADPVLERLRRATADEEMRVAVSDLQNVLYEDPPAVFLIWPVVARAVSNRFVVPGESGRDVMGTLWQWRPADLSSR